MPHNSSHGFEHTRHYRTWPRKLTYLCTYLCLYCQIVGFGLMMASCHALGWWLDWEAAHAHAHAYISTRKVIEARVKLECEKEQQEQLLLSVIPAYIAAEVSVDLLPCIVRRGSDL